MSQPCGAVSALIGREAELEHIRLLFERASSAAASLVLAGEAGIGKTRLWESALASGRYVGWRVLSARAVGSEVRLSFAVVADLFGAVSLEVARELPAIPRRALLAALGVADDVASPEDRRALGAALVAALQVLSATSPVVVAIDDAQWIDAASLRALQFTLRRLDRERVAVIVTVREPAPDTTEDFLRSLPRTERRSIGPLTVAALHHVIRGATSSELSRTELLKIHQQTGGNPFYALELVGLRPANGASSLAPSDGALPRSLRAATRARIARLSSRARETLAVAALLSRPRVSLLRTVLADAAGLDRDLASAEMLGVVGIAGDEIRFTHPLLAAAITSSIPRLRIAELHRLIGVATSEPEEKARHLALATSAPDEVVAASLERAAAHARDRGAPESAAELAELALRLTPDGHPVTLLRRGVAASDHHYAAGDSDRALSLLEAALPLAPSGAERARVLLKLAAGHRGHFAHRDELLRAAIAEAAGDRRLLAEARCTRALFLQMTQGLRAPEDDARAALALAEEIGDADLLAACRAVVLRIDLLSGRPIEAEQVLRTLDLERAGSALALEWRWDPISIVIVLTFARDFEALTRRLEASCEAARKAGDISLLGPLAQLAWIERRLGHREAGRRHAEEAYELAQQAGLEAAQPMCLVVLLRFMADSGDPGLARALGRQCFDACARTGRPDWELSAHIILGTLELSLGDAARASEHFGIAHREAEERGFYDVSVYTYISQEVEALCATGQLERARAITKDFSRRVAARTMDNDLSRGSEAHCRAAVAAAEGDVATAETAFAEAILRTERLPLESELGTTLFSFGSWQRRMGRNVESRRSLERAAEIFERQGLAHWRERALSELRRIGGRTASPQHLSETERQIAALVAAGRSNKEVAAALSISTKTVAWNLTKVYEKLGVRSRTELAARRNQLET